MMRVIDKVIFWSIGHVRDVGNHINERMNLSYLAVDSWIISRNFPIIHKFHIKINQ